MTGLARPLLALAAVLTHAAGPALWAAECACGPECGDGFVAACGCGDACGGCCEEETPADPAGCGCELMPPSPAQPAAPAPTPTPVPAAAFTAPAVDIVPSADPAGAGVSDTLAEHAADPPVRVRLCVWRN